MFAPTFPARFGDTAAGGFQRAVQTCRKHPSTWVKFLCCYKGLDKLLAANNVLVGQGTLTGGVKRWSADLAANLVKGSKAPQPAASKTADIQTDHNITTGWESFAQASRYDYRLKPGEVTQFKPIPLDLVNGVSLMPKRQYIHPTHTRPLATTVLLP